MKHDQASSTENFVRQAAEELARAIQITPAWCELEAARTAFQADPDLTALTGQLRKLSAHYRQLRSEGQVLPGREAMELAAVQEKIQQHDLFLRQQAAAGEFVALLQETNQAISEKLGVDFASNAAPRAGCCG